MADLAGQVAAVTGAGRGIGRALALGLARAGARVMCLGRDPETLAATVAAIGQAGGAARALRCDVSRADEVEPVFARIAAEEGGVGLLFCNAGSFRAAGPLWQADPAAWWGDVTTNLYGTFLCLRAVLPGMIARGRGIVITMDGGGGAHGPLVGGSGYGASKAAVVRMTEGLARELERIGSPVLAFAMNPGFVRTDMTRAVVATEPGSLWLDFVRELIRQGSGHAPEDCAAATLRLIGIAGPELNGCAFDVETDFDAVHRDRARIARDRSHTLALRA